MRFSLYNRKYLNQYKGGILNLYAEIILNSEAIEIDRPFGVRSKPVEGFILDLKAEEEMKVSFKMKNILSVENEEPVITEDDLKLINFLREEYLCKYIDAIRLLIPVGILKGAKSKSRNVIVFIDDNLEKIKNKDGYIETIDFIKKNTGKYTKRYGGNLIFLQRQVVTDAVGKIIDDVGKAFDSVGNIVEDVGNSLHQQINKMT